MFWKTFPVSWQLAQPDEIPVWLIVHVRKPFGMVVVVWHNSHAAVVVMCVSGLLTVGIVAGASTAPVTWNVCPLWQEAQPVEIPVWLIVQVEKPPVVVMVWQDTHVATGNGMWVDGFPLTNTLPNVVSPEGRWQVSQAVVLPFAL